MDISKGTEKINDEGAVEVNVETVDYRTAAGQDEPEKPEKVVVTHLIHDEKQPEKETPAGGDEPEKEKVEITHLIRDEKQPVGGGTVAEAAAEMANSLQSTKEALFESTGNNKQH